ncbi:hypothetical protein A2V56_03785 [Candidatus Woesebacteria bacterium RBG_19FT_COMBO_42_9]|uniref:DUF4157 domain-containing protein n=1 Tax=Candidatus Woesebacteria bacterium RBG_16_42_24 TaxID=1802485 RepID=A0A1F7XM94_9BACT|nr:MAG: hypothetical protein A2V97_00455 [Candidatus Woesebacteria bacterium RBG_16_42_24]OGM17587.1 MAG: hypothetical protein A2V56_03785 [Candidatus Woesebacteria bacterium RBG_19FT_COMBO_42_9]OGM67094.1 MAG: hypothetical protein A2985_02470 [Candidatus Woesebacteria bacterium RIFCSPLOWO2_01_FULL_43_11]
MQIPSNVRVKKFPWTILPILSKYSAHAIYPNVYLPRNIYEDLLTKQPNSKNVSILVHEQTHIERQKQLGWLLWGFKYCFIGRFRLNEELEAIKSSMKYLKSKGKYWDTEKSAKSLSGYLYLWCVDFKTAKAKLEKAWSEA